MPKLGKTAGWGGFRCESAGDRFGGAVILHIWIERRFPPARVRLISGCDELTLGWKSSGNWIFPRVAESVNSTHTLDRANEKR